MSAWILAGRHSGWVPVVQDALAGRGDALDCIELSPRVWGTLRAENSAPLGTRLQLISERGYNALFRRIHNVVPERVPWNNEVRMPWFARAASPHPDTREEGA